MAAAPASSKVNTLGVRAAVHHDTDQSWLDGLCRASSLPSNDLGRSFSLSSLTELFSMFRHSTVKANAGQKNQHACIQNDNDQL